MPPTTHIQIKALLTSVRSSSTAVAQPPPSTTTALEPPSPTPSAVRLVVSVSRRLSLHNSHQPPFP